MTKIYQFTTLKNPNQIIIQNRAILHLNQLHDNNFRDLNLYNPNEAANPILLNIRTLITPLMVKHAKGLLYGYTYQSGSNEPHTN